MCLLCGVFKDLWAVEERGIQALSNVFTDLKLSPSQHLLCEFHFLAPLTA